MNQEEFYDCFKLSRQQVREGIAVIGTQALKDLHLFIIAHEDKDRPIKGSDIQYVKDLSKYTLEIMIEEMKKDLEYIDKDTDDLVKRLGI